ncbi:hypothetical protein [Jiangella mangrovi]|uniref:Uncharacterized protein n=1 Tax=Jiangella mangrovi TaxID=1524084 RepID=A0A7W9GLB0_9ACTN|nr:hypothetical protein [Jiangella mangrovi]MBB5785987.1 hypothetical protein [Jiangella mangrovi]
MKIQLRHLVLAHRVLDALVTDDNGRTHRVGYLGHEGWFCTCTAGKRCEAIAAVKDVTISNLEDQ